MASNFTLIFYTLSGFSSQSQDEDWLKKKTEKNPLKRENEETPKFVKKLLNQDAFCDPFSLPFVFIEANVVDGVAIVS